MKAWASMQENEKGTNNLDEKYDGFLAGEKIIINETKQDLENRVSLSIQSLG